MITYQQQSYQIIKCNERGYCVFQKYINHVGQFKRFQKWSFILLKKSFFLCDAFIRAGTAYKD